MGSKDNAGDGNKRSLPPPPSIGGGVIPLRRPKSGPAAAATAESEPEPDSQSSAEAEAAPPSEPAVSSPAQAADARDDDDEAATSKQAVLDEDALASEAALPEPAPRPRAKPKPKPKPKPKSKAPPRIVAPGPSTRPVDGTLPKDPTLTRVRLTEAGIHDPDSIDADSTGVRVIEQVRLEPGELVTGTRYRIVGWLGEGGMGVVYECEHVDIERRVALKVLRTGVDPTSRRARMFREEARAVSRAGRSEDGQVSNIVEIYDFGELPDGRMWFAMELLHGRSFARMLAEGAMDPARLIGVLRQLCKGLGAAHDAGVIHRDIKPGNVMLARDRGRDDVVKVVDFGVAAVLAEGDGPEVQLEGTPNYMAPEQATGGSFDHRLDIYAVGAVGFHMLAGGPPFQGDDVFQVLRKVCTEPPPRPSELNPEAEIPAPLEDVILRCLAKDPNDRYDDMRDLEAALCEAQIAAKLVTGWDDLPLPEVEPPARLEAIKRGMPKPLVGKPRSGRTRAWIGAAVVTLALVGGGILYARQDDASAEIQQRIDEHVAAARAAAARALYIYPPADDPKARTAYVEVVELENLEGELGKAAVETAAALRTEFGETLVRLGDQYWSSPGARPFAIDYYLSAMVFDPSLQVQLRDRAAITMGQLAELQRKAATLDFDASELSASEPLLALAEDDEQERARKLGELSTKGDQHSAQTGLQIQKLLEEQGVEPKVAASHKPRKSTPRKIEPTITPTDELELPSETKEVEVGSDVVRDSDAERATGLVREGLNALRAGKRDRAETLFLRALDADHTNHQALDGLAQAHFGRGDYQGAVTFGRRAVRQAPKRGSYRIHLGDAYFKVFRFQEAREQYQRASELGHGEAKGRLDKVKAKLGQ